MNEESNTTKIRLSELEKAVAQQGAQIELQREIIEKMCNVSYNDSRLLKGLISMEKTKTDGVVATFLSIEKRLDSLLEHCDKLTNLVSSSLQHGRDLSSRVFQMSIEVEDLKNTVKGETTLNNN